ncbi:hypothetical protein LE190_12065 [Massilia oculi]|uniref:DUF2147 domain-containing protein n=1 Tax=Massilia hydrophila TaxID=3044279 RepID=A0ABS7YAC9_9BURK|nr:hypothetical protein [Massilia oculi]MCA1856653.1 hypothetical protein [Massilia oculi]
MRGFSFVFLAAGLLAAATAWAEPVPADKMAYVGNWHGKDMQLSLTKEGKIVYRRAKPNSQVDLSMDLQGFKGNDFDAGVRFMKTTFVVSKPPRRENGKWTMTVDGVELTRDA